MSARGDRWVVTRGPRWDGASNSWHYNGHVYEDVAPGEAGRYRIHCDRVAPQPETAPQPESRPAPPAEPRPEHPHSTRRTRADRPETRG